MHHSCEQETQDTGRLDAKGAAPGAQEGLQQDFVVLENIQGSLPDCLLIIPYGKEWAGQIANHGAVTVTIGRGKLTFCTSSGNLI